MTNKWNQKANGEEAEGRERERENVLLQITTKWILLHLNCNIKKITFESHIVIFIGNVRKEKDKLEVEMEKEALGGRNHKREIMNVVVEIMKLSLLRFWVILTRNGSASQKIFGNG